MKKSKNNISNWLDRYGDPEIDKFVEKNLAIIEKVRLALEDKGWNKGQFAQAMGKSPSEISKWLTGMHNLTLKSIVKMEQVLGVDLIHTEPTKQYEYVYLGTIRGKDDFEKKKKEYSTSCYEDNYAVAM